MSIAKVLGGLATLSVMLCCISMAATVSAPQSDADGFLVHEVKSQYQSDRTQIRVLLPSRLDPKTKYPVIYVLPVEAARGTRWGDGLLEVKRAQLHDRCRAIFVAPTFSNVPWYADHPSDPQVRQETYFTSVVVPFIDESYPTQASASGRLLLGFSKSGWGAWSLLLRHPALFGRAAAWDAPLMMSWPTSYGSDEIFATRENFQQYEIQRLLRSRVPDLQSWRRLILTGFGGPFRLHHQQTHEVLLQLGIPHDYRDGPERTHHWDSGWVAETVELLQTCAPATRESRDGNR